MDTRHDNARYQRRPILRHEQPQRRPRLLPPAQSLKDPRRKRTRRRNRSSKLQAATETLRIEQDIKNLKHGWVEGSVQDFLDLSEADVEYIETRRLLSRLLKERRGKLRPSDEKKGMMSVVSVL